MLKKSLLLLLAFPVMASASTLYRCTDEFGHTTYTNYKAANRKCIVLSHDESPAKASTKEGTDTTPSVKATPSDFPKVASETQKSRDGDRRYILEQELDTEKKHLDEARKSLSDLLATTPVGTSQDRAKPIRDRIALHERNLDALQREISHLK